MRQVPDAKPENLCLKLSLTLYSSWMTLIFKEPLLINLQSGTNKSKCRNISTCMDHSGKDAQITVRRLAINKVS